MDIHISGFSGKNYRFYALLLQIRGHELGMKFKWGEKPKVVGDF